MKKRCTFTLEPDLVDRLRAIQARTGISQSEQVRRGIRCWLESREWPAREAGEERTRRGKAGGGAPGPHRKGR